MDKTKETLLRHFPENYRKLFAPVSFEGLEEIRFRSGCPVCLYYCNKRLFLSLKGVTDSPEKARQTDANEIITIAAHLCDHSIYAHLNDLKEGFITIPGGHRIGFSGKSVIKNGQITGLSALSGINLRIAREYKGCARTLATQLTDNRKVKNTLLIAPPQCGKTTYLRDLVRIFSANYKITIVDERSEIAGMVSGTPGFDIGIHTDVLDRFPKAEGMLLALRSLSPDILVTDELGAPGDIHAVQKLYGAGCGIIATLHGDNLTELQKTKKELFSYFNVAVLMGRKNGIPSVLSIENLR